MRKLKFLGIGHCSNIADGNTSAFYKERNYLLLIDCGEDVFDKIMEHNLLDNILVVDILITNISLCCAGSLSRLILYLNERKDILPTVYFNSNKLKDLFLAKGQNNLNYTFNKARLMEEVPLNNCFREMVMTTFTVNGISSYKIVSDKSIIIYNTMSEFFPKIKELLKNKSKDTCFEYYHPQDVLKPIPKYLCEYTLIINVSYKDIVLKCYPYNEYQQKIPEIYNGKQSLIVNERIEFLTSESYLHGLPCTWRDEDILDIITGISIAEYDKKNKTFKTFLPESPEDYEVISWEDVCDAIENNIWLIIDN